jgi:hypothetical protein
MVGRAVAGSGSSLAVAARHWQRQQRGDGCGSAAAARWQHSGSVAVAAQWWLWQLGGSGSAAAEAAIGDGQDEGGEVVSWRLFMFVIFLHIVQSRSAVLKGLTS